MIWPSWSSWSVTTSCLSFSFIDRCPSQSAPALWSYGGILSIHSGPGLDGCDDVYMQSYMGMSLVDPDVVLFVDHVSILISSPSPSELKESSQVPARQLPLEPADGLAKLEIGGRCAFNRLLVSRFCGLAKADFEVCDNGDCICISVARERGFGVQEIMGDVRESTVSRSCVLGKYKGLHIGHEIPARSNMSATH